jgi:hypothetical protein
MNRALKLPDIHLRKVVRERKVGFRTELASVSQLLHKNQLPRSAVIPGDPNTPGSFVVRRRVRFTADNEGKSGMDRNDPASRQSGSVSFIRHRPHIVTSKSSKIF